MRKTIAFAAALCTFSWPALATEYVVPVYLAAKGGTNLTDRFIYEFKEAIRKSSTMSLADAKEDAFQIASITALNIREEGVAYSFARSWLIDNQEIFVTHYAGVCDESRFAYCARDLLSVLATGVDQDRASILETMKKQQQEGQDKKPAERKSF